MLPFTKNVVIGNLFVVIGNAKAEISRVIIYAVYPLIKDYRFEYSTDIVNFKGEFNLWKTSKFMAN